MSLLCQVYGQTRVPSNAPSKKISIAIKTRIRFMSVLS